MRDLSPSIVDVLQSAPMTASELRRVLRASPNSVYDALSMLIARHDIEMCPRINRGWGHGRDKPYRLRHSHRITYARNARGEEIGKR